MGFLQMSRVALVLLGRNRCVEANVRGVYKKWLFLPPLSGRRCLKYALMDDLAHSCNLNFHRLDRRNWQNFVVAARALSRVNVKSVQLPQRGD